MILHDGLPEILPPSENGIFQSTFTRNGSEPALREFLADILERPLIKVAVISSELPLNDIHAKREIFDINCIAEDEKTQIDIEMQATPMEGDTLENERIQTRSRSVFNLCDLHANQKGRGVRYADFYRSYQIMICNYKVFDWKNEIVEAFTYRNKNGRQLSDITTAIFMDLTKADELSKKSIEEMTAIELWVMFLAKASDPKYKETISRITDKKGGIQVAYDMLTTISADQRARAIYRSRQIWQRDREHEMAAAIYGEREKWQDIVADKDAKLADKDAKLADKDAKLADKDAKLADKDAENARLREQLAALQSHVN